MSNSETPSTTPQLSRRRKLLFAAVMTVAVVVVVEVGFRIAENTPRYIPSDTLGYELNPGYHRSHRRHDESVNALGLRGAETTAAKPAGTFRILAMGGSTTYGYALDDTATWPHLLEAELRDRGHVVEVLNGGVSGWGLEQIALALGERRLAELNPDLVLIYSGWNHPERDNPGAREFERKAGKYRHWTHRSAVVRGVGRWARRRRAEGKAVLRPKVAAWEQHQREIAELRVERLPVHLERIAVTAKERVVRVAVIDFPGLVQMASPAEPEARSRFEELLGQECREPVPPPSLVGIRELEYRSAVDTNRDAVKQLGLPLLDVAGRMKRQVDVAGEAGIFTWLDYFSDRLHLTPSGNRAVALAAADELVEKGLLPESGKKAATRP